jgi:LEA14-like dessication related protein
MQVYGDLQQQNSYISWPKCYNRLKKIGIKKSIQSCKEKVKNLRRAFIKIHKTYNETKINIYAMNCPYWVIMNNIWGNSIELQSP